jgi:MFS family permease
MAHMRPGASGMTGPGGGGGAFTALHFQQFRWLFASNQAFFFAMNGQMIVRSYLAYDLTGSPLALGIVNLVVAIPMLIASPFGGVIADRLERRRLIMLGQAAVILNEFVILALIATGVIAFWHLVAMSLVMGSIFPLMMPARQAIVVNVIGKENLGSAMALQMGGMNLARVVAPVLAGFLIYLTGLELTYVVAIVLYVLGLLAMFRVHPSRAEAPALGRTVFGDIAEGVRYTLGTGPVRGLLLLGIVPMTLMMPFQTLLVVFSEDVWNTGSRGLGILQGAAGFGGIIGSVIVAARAQSPTIRLMMSSLLLFAGGLFLFALSPWFLMGVAMVLFADIFIAMFQTLNSTSINIIIPDAVRGRVMSLMMMTFGLTPLGSLPVSAAAEAFGAPAAVAGASLVSALIVLGFIFFNRSLRAVDSLVRENLAQAPARGFGPGAAAAASAPAQQPVPTGTPGS